jgi:hypothetical protein
MELQLATGKANSLCGYHLLLSTVDKRSRSGRWEVNAKLDLTIKPMEENK